jgi:hypothetical protein
MGYTVVFSDRIVIRELNKTVFSEDVLNQKDFDKINKEAFNLTKKAASGLDFEVDGIRIFDSFISRITYTSINIFKTITLLRKALSGLKIKKMLIKKEGISREEMLAAEYFCRQKKIDFESEQPEEFRTKNVFYGFGKKQEGSRIIFHVSNVNHVQIALPYYKEFRKRANCLILANYFAPRALEKERIPYKATVGYLTPGIFFRSLRLAEKAGRFALNKLKKMEFEFEGIRLRELFVGEIEGAMQEELQENIEYILLIMHALKKEKTDTLIYFQENGPKNRMLGRIAKKTVISCSWIQSGLLKNQGPEDMQAHYSDCFFAYDEYSAKSFRDLGADPHKVFCLPSRKRISFGAEEMREMKNRLGINNSEKTVFFVHQYLPDSENELMLSEFFKLTKKIRANFIFKVHPNAWSENHETLIGRINPDIIYIGKESKINPQLLTAISDVVVTKYSTLGYDAILLKKMAIIFDVTKQANPFERRNLAVPAGRGELEKTIKEILSNRNDIAGKKIRKIEDFISRGDGKISNPEFVWDKLQELRH